MIARIKFFTLEVDIFGFMHAVAVLGDLVKNSSKNFIKFTNKTQREIGLNRQQLNKAVKRLVEYGVLEFYRGKNIRIYRIVKQKL